MYIYIYYIIYILYIYVQVWPNKSAWTPVGLMIRKQVAAAELTRIDSSSENLMEFSENMATPKTSVACHRYPHENGNCLLDILYNYIYIYNCITNGHPFPFNSGCVKACVSNFYLFISRSVYTGKYLLICFCLSRPCTFEIKCEMWNHPQIELSLTLQWSLPLIEIPSGKLTYSCGK